MKTLIALSFAALSLNSFAGDIAGRYYSPEFTITKISPLCPKPAPGQVTCMAYGSKVTISATLGCVDKLLFHEVKTFPTRKGMVIQSVAVAYADPMSLRALCFRENTVKKVISVPEIDGNITIVNEIIEN